MSQLESFAALVGRLVERDALGVVVVAGPGEESWAEAARSAAPSRVPILGPRLDLAELAAVLARLDVLVTNDSGPMHVAAAAGTSCVALFGPTDPRRTSPAWPGRWPSCRCGSGITAPSRSSAGPIARGFSSGIALAATAMTGGAGESGSNRKPANAPAEPAPRVTPRFPRPTDRRLRSAREEAEPRSRRRVCAGRGRWYPAAPRNTHGVVHAGAHLAAQDAKP